MNELKKHIAEDVLESLLLFPDTLPPGELVAISAHLTECALCREQIESLTAFYADLQKNNAAEPSRRDAEFAKTIMGRDKVLPQVRRNEDNLGNLIEAYGRNAERGVVPGQGKFLRLVRTSPARVATAFTMAAALVAMAVFLLRPSKNIQPDYFKEKDDFLIVYNNHGDELWRKRIGPGYSAENYIRGPLSADDGLIGRVIDVDGDGRNEVVFVTGWVPETLPVPTRNCVLCYSNEGKELWRYELHRNIAFGKMEFEDSYSFISMVVRPARNGRHPEVVAVAGHPWLPCGLVRIDARTGAYISEYWHPGTIRQLEIASDREGKDMLWFSGKNGAFGFAFISAIDVDSLRGHGPMPDSLLTERIHPAHEKFYVLIPGSDLQKAWVEPSCVWQFKLLVDGGVEAEVKESILGLNAFLYFSFDSSYACTKVYPGNSFNSTRKQLVDKGELHGDADDGYCDELRKAVRYWNGSSFELKGGFWSDPNP